LASALLLIAAFWRILLRVSSDDELVAFGAGGIDGAASSPGMMRKAIEGDDYQAALN
jgi:hypothetical protein